MNFGILFVVPVLVTPALAKTYSFVAICVPTLPAVGVGAVGAVEIINSPLGLAEITLSPEPAKLSISKTPLFFIQNFLRKVISASAEPLAAV